MKLEGTYLFNKFRLSVFVYCVIVIGCFNIILEISLLINDLIQLYITYNVYFDGSNNFHIRAKVYKLKPDRYSVPCCVISLIVQLFLKH